MPILQKPKSSPQREECHVRQSVKVSFWPTWEENKTFSLVLVVGAMLVLSWLMVLIRNDMRAYFYLGKAPQETGSIAISGEGKVTSVADIAQINLGMNTEAATVEKAQKDNTDKMNTLIAALKGLGVDQKDIKTTNYNIYPVYDYTDTRGRQLKGYAVDQSVEVKIRDLNNVSKALSIAGSSGLNQIGGLSFTIDDPEALRQEARLKAIKNAQEKASALAKSLGVGLGRMVSFNESSNSPSPYVREALAYKTLDSGAVAPTIEPGSQEININVSISWEILN